MKIVWASKILSNLGLSFQKIAHSYFHITVQVTSQAKEDKFPYPIARNAVTENLLEEALDCSTKTSYTRRSRSLKIDETNKKLALAVEVFYSL